MIPLKTVEELIIRHSSIEKDLSTGGLDNKLFAEKSKEYSDLNEIVGSAKDYISFQTEKEELEKILNDSSADGELKKMADIELIDLQNRYEANEKKLKLFLLPKDEADKKNAIIEIRAGTGGLEASLFASDLFKMYEKVSHKKKWSLELISISRSDAGGLKEVIASVKGTNIYSTLKYESGVHRVQRVPDTETQGRVHTSAATVAVLPEAEEVDLKINESEVRPVEDSTREEERVPMSRMRSTIAKRLLSVTQETAMLTTFNEVDMQPIKNLRNEYGEDFKQNHGLKLGFMGFFVAASIIALKKYPIANASIDGSDVIYHGYQDISVAVSTDKGLVVPVIRDADMMTLPEIEKVIIEFSSKAQEGKLSIEEMQGGTFTISNGGVFGSLLSTPILNAPQTAILGLSLIHI